MGVKLEKGQKRKGAPAPTAKGTVSNDPKSKLYNGCSRILGRPVTKEDIVFDVEEQDGMLVAKVTLSAFDGVTVTGKPVDASSNRKKDAENSAAQAAVTKYAKEFKKKKDKKKKK